MTAHPSGARQGEGAGAPETAPLAPLIGQRLGSACAPLRTGASR